MAGTMSEADLVADLKRSLHDAGNLFDAADDADYKRFLAQSLPAMQTKRPITRLGQVTLVAGTSLYGLAAYPVFADYKTHLWAEGMPCRRPWDTGYPGALPRVSAARDGAAWKLVFDAAPTWLHISAYGSIFRFWYFGLQVVGDANTTTIAPADRGLLLLRAQAEALRELAIRNVTKPVALRDGFSGQPRNSTPAALFEVFLKLFGDAR